MPISAITMRDIWDKEGEEKEVKKYKTFSPEIGKYYLEYLAKKNLFLEGKREIVKIFADYEKHLGEAGFLKF